MSIDTSTLSGVYLQRVVVEVCMHLHVDQLPEVEADVSIRTSNLGQRSCHQHDRWQCDYICFMRSAHCVHINLPITKVESDCSLRFNATVQ